MRTARTVPWWRALTDAGAHELPLDALGTPFPEGVDDPWGHLVTPVPGLTADQRSALGALDDQPAIPRLRTSEDR